MLMAGLYILANYSKLFTNYFRNELLRQNIVVWLASLCMIMALAPVSGDFFGILIKKGVLYAIMVEVLFATVNTLFVFNITRFVATRQSIRRKSFIKQKAIVLVALIICAILINIPLNYIFNNFSAKNIKYSVLFSFYNACVVGMVYVAMSYIDLERKRKLNQKELEVAKLNELKTKAELEALHAKINPHFLYNALNSIADLSITDGKKARRMTIALADLFRFSINYSNNNYSTIREELEMAEVYLQIEKIRFEDQLTYSIHVKEGIDQYLVPRFILQPVVENAVKHGLKSTGKMTDIFVEVLKEEDRIIMNVADNGPLFPDELIPGYGVKSIYDKLDLLFPGEYEVKFSNQPRKQVSIAIINLKKNEPGV
jgi:sensor histidine kinase YesM